MFSLQIDNKRLQNENREQRSQIDELREDVKFLKDSIENHVPVIAQLEQKNQELEDLLHSQIAPSSTKQQNKQVAAVQQKLRALEERFESQEQGHQQERVKLNLESKSLKERLESVKNMNMNLQKQTSKMKHKVDNFDFITQKCKELHKAN